MLSSIDTNGEVPDAHILVAGFNLTAEDRAILMAGAGQAWSKLQVIDITEADLIPVGARKFSKEYPPAVLGRLLLADHTPGANARPLTVYRDMIINNNIAPLFDLDMDTEFFAAIRYPPPSDASHYFNTGITLFYVDKYNYHQSVSRRSAERGSSPGEMGNLLRRRRASADTRQARVRE